MIHRQYHTFLLTRGNKIMVKASCINFISWIIGPPAQLCIHNYIALRTSDNSIKAFTICKDSFYNNFFILSPKKCDNYALLQDLHLHTRLQIKFKWIYNNYILFRFIVDRVTHLAMLNGLVIANTHSSSFVMSTNYPTSVICGNAVAYMYN